MLDMLLAQLGIKKEDVYQLGKKVTDGVDNIERRLERIENALGITDPLPDSNIVEGEDETE